MTQQTLSILALSLGLMLSAPLTATAAADDPQPLTVSTAPATGQAPADDAGLCTAVCPLPG